MAIIYENPSNGYREVSSAPWLWTLVFGPFYFGVKGWLRTTPSAKNGYNSHESPTPTNCPFNKARWLWRGGACATPRFGRLQSAGGAPPLVCLRR